MGDYLYVYILMGDYLYVYIYIYIYYCVIIYFYCMLKVFKNTSNCIFICMIPFSKLKIVKKWVLRKWVFIFWLRFRRHFLRHTNFFGF